MSFLPSLFSSCFQTRKPGSSGSFPTKQLRLKFCCYFCSHKLLIWQEIRLLRSAGFDLPGEICLNEMHTARPQRHSGKHYRERLLHVPSKAPVPPAWAKIPQLFSKMHLAKNYNEIESNILLFNKSDKRKLSQTHCRMQTSISDKGKMAPSGNDWEHCAALIKGPRNNQLFAEIKLSARSTNCYFLNFKQHYFQRLQTTVRYGCIFQMGGDFTIIV